MKKQIVLPAWAFIAIIIFALAIGWLSSLVVNEKWVRFARSSKKDYSKKYEPYKKIASKYFMHAPMPVDVADAFVKDYRDNVIPKLRTLTTSGDVTEAIWIPLNELSGYVNNVDPSRNDGIRIYLGRIKLSAIPADMPELREKLAGNDGQMTCIFMTTKADTENGMPIHRDDIEAEIPVNLPNDVNELCPPPRPCKGTILGEMRH
jgi:hypothetical protein